MAESPPLTTTSYADWVRRSILRNSSSRDLLVGLFESSVPEPTELLREVLLEGFGKGVTSRYTSTFVRGNPYLVAALAREYGVGEGQVLTTTGATGALSLVYRALLAPGERILIENPGFDLFANLAHATGNGVDRFERRGARFQIDPVELEAAIGPKTRLVVLSNLHNPSGMALDDETFRALAEIANRRGVTFVFDEVYGGYAGEAARPAASRGISPHFLSISSVTKLYGLSTLRCGWIVGDEATLGPIRDMAREVEFAISNLAHGIAALVVENPARFRENTFSVLGRARPIIESYHDHWRAQGLAEGDLPEHGCIAFPRLVGIRDTLHFSGWLSDRCGVLVAPGDYFGAPGHIRLGFAMEPSRLDYGLQALTDSLLTYRETHRNTDTR
ncbi:aspartate/methionine/tyrosine aminotransferase [Novosphingobium sp. PhB165]|uniref:pyridoxal phosphate-dependent aminotransferase n=1 Tax=Novosphingobium sp. PhB165 TaxID=2485105 RepID=UPI001047DF87|nr:pyridoxal phosphate-dependent aminotransferase [Novosphingobium sp. PhB165]TCM15419.1 aspartate/methionine/tyrosine aminotransferase [Novosphingobium sp. PhB165]